MSLNSLFQGVFDTTGTAAISPLHFTLCMGTSLLIGLIIALCYCFKAKTTKGFAICLATLPAVVCMVIMMVNGNLGTGVAVAGAFSLVRFRSAPGSAKEIGVIFLAMGAGLATGMGYLGYSLVFVLLLCAITLLYNHTKLGEGKTTQRYLKITIPEDLDYTEVFEDVFQEYAKNWDLLSVKTTNMGSLFKLTYDITLIANSLEKALIDDVRCRNGNLEILVSKQTTLINEL